MTGVQTCALPIYRLVAEAQFEARVGKANKGLFIVSDKVFEVSIDFPPPTEIGRASCRERV